MPENLSLNNKSRFPPENEKEAAFLHGKSEQGFDRPKALQGKGGTSCAGRFGEGKGETMGVLPLSPESFPSPSILISPYTSYNSSYRRLYSAQRPSRMAARAPRTVSRK